MISVHLRVVIAILSCREDRLHLCKLVALIEILVQFLQSLALDLLELHEAGFNAGLLLGGPFGVGLQDWMRLNILRQRSEHFWSVPWCAGKAIHD